jgi:hypothetical protein
MSVGLTIHRLLLKSLSVVSDMALLSANILNECDSEPVSEHQTGSVTLGVEHGLNVFDSRVLRKMSGLKRDQVTGNWRRQDYGELHDTYTLPNTMRKMTKESLAYS